MVDMSRIPVALRPARRALAAVIAAFVLVGLGAGGASAHNSLRSTDPADGSTVTVVPEQLTLTFDQPALAIGTEIAVLAPDGSLVSAGEPVLVDSSVSQPIEGVLPAGTYTVQWRVTSADGHPLSGELSFTASEATAIGVEAPAETAEPVAEEEPTAAAEESQPEAVVTSAVVEPEEDDALSTGQIIGIGALVMVIAGGVLVALRMSQRKKN